MTAGYDFVSASTLLRDGIYEVPDYQRNYAWETQQLRDLWEDVTGIAASSPHYTGTVIVKKLQDLTRLGKAFARFEVIDGQQRLTTTVLLLASICEELKKRKTRGAAKTAKNVLTEYIFDAGTSTYKVRLNRGDDSYLKDVILQSGSKEMVAREPATPSEVRLLDAKRYFAKEVGGVQGSDLQDLLNKILSGLRFTRFEVDTDAEAGLIFEVTNNRGRPLSQLDKIKNYLMYVSYKGGDPQLATSINESWAEILKNVLGLERIREEEVLRYHWVMRTGEPKEYDVHRRLKLRLRPPFGQEHLSFIRDYVNGLKEASFVLRELHSPESGFTDCPAGEKRRIVHHLSGLNRLRVFATFLPLLAASRITLKGQPSLFRSVAAACEAFALRVYKIAGRRADTGLSMFCSQARLMFDARGSAEQRVKEVTSSVLRSIGQSVSSYGDDANITSALSEENILNRLDGYEIRYVLGEFERWKCEQAKERALRWKELEKATIEHIVPRYPSGWQGWSDARWLEHGRIVNNLGNLTLTFWNSELSNKAFSYKRLKYGESNLRIQRELGGHRVWKKNQIKERTDEITEFLVNRWSVPTA
jgi:hypothetical protein